MHHGISLERNHHHNLLLCIWSLVMCLGALVEVLLLFFTQGYSFTDLVCDNIDGVRGNMMTGRLGFWAWMYYVSKV